MNEELKIGLSESKLSMQGYEKKLSDLRGSL